MSDSLYNKYRPKKLSQVFGQDGAISSLQKLMDKNRVPHALLFTGPSGCGKTTLARIVKNHLQCGDMDFQEINAADAKGIDMVRDMRRAMNLAPIDGPCRIWLIDEAGKLTGEAQAALLKMLEDTPSHVYFQLATTDPQKLLKTIHTRCTEIKLKPIGTSDLVELLESVCKAEEFEVSEEVLDELIDAADGSARKALVILEQIAYLPNDEEQIKGIQASTINKDEAIELARAIFSRASWADVAKILKNLENQDVEGIRYLVLGYARRILLGGGKLSPRAFAVIDIFGRAFYDSKTAGLTAACYEAVTKAP